MSQTMNTPPALVYPLNHYRLQISIVSRHRNAESEDLSEIEETSQICERYFSSRQHDIHLDVDVDMGIMTRIIDETLPSDYMTRVQTLKQELKNAGWDATLLIQLGTKGQDKMAQMFDPILRKTDNFDEFLKKSNEIYEYIEKRHSFTL